MVTIAHRVRSGGTKRSEMMNYKDEEKEREKERLQFGVRCNEK
jgi:hypothetical protein